jgi:hypothetical protein
MAFAPTYTRSRDTLKSIRPQGHHFAVFSTGIAKAWKSKNDEPIEAVAITEELGELHAISQAIEYERHSRDASEAILVGRD